MGSLRVHLLVSVPDPFVPELENAHVGDRHLDFLWLLPPCVGPEPVSGPPVA